MYDKITILADTGFIINHLSMNGYNFEAIGQNLYIYHEETAYVQEILADNDIRYRINDVPFQMQTERGLISVSEWFKDGESARDNGFSPVFKAHGGNVELYSKTLDDRGFYHTFAIIG